MRRRRLLVALAAMVVLVPACGEGDEPKNDVRGALRDTARRASTFVYQERTRQSTIEVKGLIEDDFRYSAQVSVDDQPVLEQVVSDDVLAVRVFEPGRLGSLVADPEAAKAGTSIKGVTVAQALASRRWVVDPVGAPPSTSDADDLDRSGQDPIRDARIVFDYVERAIGSAFRVVLYNPDSLEYNASEDPFPTPEEGSDVRRYDVLPPFIPAPDAVGSGGGLPGTLHLRKMSVYVQDGLVIRIVERVAAEGDIGDRLEFYLEETLERVDPGQADQFATALEGLDEADRSDFLIGTLNEVLRLSGEEPVRPRDMTIDFVDGGDNQVEVPTEAVEASLALFRAPDEEEADAETGSGVETAGSGASSTTTTTAGT